MRFSVINQSRIREVPLTPMTSRAVKCMRLCALLLMPALAVADVEGNFLVVTAFKFTTITHVQLLDCFTVPCVIVLSYFFLKCRYNVWQHAGAAACVTGDAPLPASLFHSL